MRYKLKLIHFAGALSILVLPFYYRSKYYEFYSSIIITIALFTIWTIIIFFKLKKSNLTKDYSSKKQIVFSILAILSVVIFSLINTYLVQFKLMYNLDNISSVVKAIIPIFIIFNIILVLILKKAKIVTKQN